MSRKVIKKGIFEHQGDFLARIHDTVKVILTTKTFYYYGLWTNDFVSTNTLLTLIKILKFAKVPCQDVLTKDSASLSVDGMVMFRVFDPVKSIQNVEKYKESIIALGSTTLRNILGISTLNEILFGDFDRR